MNTKSKTVKTSRRARLRIWLIRILAILLTLLLVGGAVYTAIYAIL